MNEDPYSGIINMMRQEGAAFNPPSFCLGEVIEPFPNLIVKVGDLPIYKEDIKIADYLLNGHSRQIKITDSLNEAMNIGGKIEYQDSLGKGDEVALLPLEDGNRYILLARIV